MTEVIKKAEVVISEKAWRQIKWLTFNMSTEIGAVGTAYTKTDEGGEPYFYVDKLFFPDQKVSGATVNIQAQGWGRILKQMTPEEKGQINFYWHRHPGGSHHSSTDQDDTFDTFMSKEAGRDWFVFLQTAGDNMDKFNYELRVELRQPVRATLMGTTHTKLMYLTSPKQQKFEEFLEKQNAKMEEFLMKEINQEEKELEQIIKDVIIH